MLLTDAVQVTDFVDSSQQTHDLQIRTLSLHRHAMELYNTRNRPRYDTSFLCAPNAWKAVDDLRNKIDTATSLLYTIQSHIIPKSVQREIHSHLGNPDKEMVGKTGRINVAKLIALGNYSESDPPQKTVQLEGILRPDSPVDCEVLSTGAELAQADPECAVYVFSNDGGILTQVSYLATKQKLKMFSPASVEQFLELLQEMPR
jgi:hypothetical protein